MQRSAYRWNSMEERELRRAFERVLWAGCVNVGAAVVRG
jgi:hypothetical protein